ncbi:MAG: hypothetical protein AAFN92_04740, partial [Bacteroidota bacterium]
MKFLYPLAGRFGLLCLLLCGGFSLLAQPATDPADCSFGYGMQFNQSNLQQIDMATGASVDVGTITGFPRNITSAALAGGALGNGLLFFADLNNSDSLYALNIATAEVMGIDTLAELGGGADFWIDFEYDPNTDRFFGLYSPDDCSALPSVVYEIILGSPIQYIEIGDAGSCGNNLVINGMGDAFVIDILSNEIAPFDLTTGTIGSGVGITYSATGNPINLNQTQSIRLSCLMGTPDLKGFLFDNNQGTIFGALDPATGVFTEEPGSGPYPGASMALFSTNCGFDFGPGVDECSNDTEAPVLVCQDVEVFLDENGEAS